MVSHSTYFLEIERDTMHIEISYQGRYAWNVEALEKTGLAKEICLICTFQKLWIFVVDRERSVHDIP